MMCDEIEILDFLEEDYNNKQQAKINRSIIRNCIKPFNMPDEMFVKRYRLTKELVVELCNELRPFMPHPKKSTHFSIEVKVLIALSFFATGSYQRPIGDIAAHSVAQQTTSAVVKQVTQCLNLPYFRQKYIKFPMDPRECRANVVGFYNKFGMPGVIGCIDGTHVAIKRAVEHEERYYCRKQYHSLNVQIICNSYLDIISVDASYGGATHDAFIWANHPLKTYLDNLSNIWLLADSGYPLRKVTMTPILNAPPNTPEAHYTHVHLQTRNAVERTIGLLKARFRCLLVHRVLHYEPIVAASIVNACVVLHNICNGPKTPVQEMTSEEIIQEAQLQPSHEIQGERLEGHSQNTELQQGVIVRRQLVAHLWSLRQNNT